jgi:uracil-DNA glycosylase
MAGRQVTKLVIIGQAPSQHGTGEPMAGRCGARLAALAGVSLDEFLRRTDRLNLFDIFTGKNGRGDVFCIHDARPIADQLCAGLTGRTVVMLGNGVSAAFGLKAPAFSFAEHRGMMAAWAPHPSGINRWWNDPQNVERAQSFWRPLLGPRSSTSSHNC